MNLVILFVKSSSGVGLAAPPSTTKLHILPRSSLNLPILSATVRGYDDFFNIFLTALNELNAILKFIQG